MRQYIAKVHHTGDFCGHIFSDSQYPKLLNSTCKHSGSGGFIVSEGVKYLTYMSFVSKLQSTALKLIHS